MLNPFQDQAWLLLHKPQYQFQLCTLQDFLIMSILIISYFYELKNYSEGYHIFQLLYIVQILDHQIVTK
ncbi:hypothetical protein pb186bvf_010240 [Paramecium bursaria]